jgi:lipopolysaccharide transport system ATP-binding protein
MSSDTAIRLENLSKCYQIYSRPHDRLKQSIFPRLQRLAGKKTKQYFSEFWAIKDVSFEIRKGETVGIIGRNGSGKSTLLQMICGTLNPTLGSIKTYGRIAALLELGSGFNPEFSGRENVYMNAAVLGLSKGETDARFDDIVDFADIGNFIDQPVKVYSSGMMVRLAFSVAINVNPEILIVDEALSVGDELFQRKCFSRIEAIRASGATILFVSHSGGQIVELCDRAILMDAGENIAIGTPKKIVGMYQKLLYAPADKLDIIREDIVQAGVSQDSVYNTEGVAILSPHDLTNHEDHPQESFDPSLKPSSTIVYESHGAHIENPAILDFRGDPVSNLIRGRTYRFVYSVRFTSNANTVRFGMLIKTVSGVELGGSASALQLKDSLTFARAGSVYRVEFSFNCTLNSGTYFLNAGVMGVTTGEDGFLHRLVDISMFRVLADSRSFVTGTIDFGCEPKIEEIVKV